MEQGKTYFVHVPLQPFTALALSTPIGLFFCYAYACFEGEMGYHGIPQSYLNPWCCQRTSDLRIGWHSPLFFLLFFLPMCMFRRGHEIARHTSEFFQLVIFPTNERFPHRVPFTLNSLCTWYAQGCSRLVSQCVWFNASLALPFACIRCFSLAGPYCICL